MSVALSDIRAAARRIKGGVIVTPCPESIPLSEITGARIFCKLEKTVVEGAAAVPLAAMMSGQLPHLQGKRVALIVGGGNIDPAILSRVIEKGLVHDGRLTRFTARISDRPGGLAELCRVIAAAGASVKDIAHDRAFSGPDVSAVQVVCTVETRDRGHVTALHRALEKNGFSVAG